MNAIVKSSPSLLMDPGAFEHMQRVGSMLALSPLFPDHLRKGTKETAIANGVLVMNMAARLNEDPLTVAQNIYFVSGKPGWSSSYMIGKANQHGVFKNPISWEIKGKGETLSVTAFGELATTGQRVEATCDMAMAKAEGWTSNKKYQSMPEQMLRYRSATFLIRLYCPEVMVGVPAQVEVELGMKDVTPADYADSASSRYQGSEAKAEEAEIVDAKPPAKAGPEKKPARQQAETSPESEAQSEADAPDAASEDPDRENMQQMANAMHADIKEAPSGAAVREHYAEQLKVLESKAPDLFSEVDKAIKEKDGQEKDDQPV